MARSNNLPQRRSIRLRDYDYSAPGIYYVTICSDDHTTLFGHIADGALVPSEVGTLALNRWQLVPKRWPPVELDQFVLMPNHLHAILLYPDTGIKLPPLGHVVNWFKRAVTIDLKERDHRVTGIWQRNYYEHIVRDDQDLNRIRQYIEFNPGRWEEDEYYRRDMQS